MKTVLVVMLTLIPNILIIVTTVYLLVLARKIARRGPVADTVKWQGILSTILVAVVYSISTLPYSIFALIADTNQSNPHDFFRTHFHRIAKSLICINSISNFYIYTMSITSFREFLCAKIIVFQNCVSEDQNRP